MTASTAAPITVNNAPTVPASFWDHFVRLAQDKSQPVVIEKGALELLMLEDVFQLAKNVVASQD